MAARLARRVAARSVRGIVCLLVFGLAAEALAEESPSPPAVESDSSSSSHVTDSDSPGQTAPTQEHVRHRTKEVTKDKSGGDDIDVTLEQIKIFKDAGRLRRRPLIPAWDCFQRRLSDRYGLKIGLAYTAIYQHATGADGPRDAAGGDLDVITRWRAFGCEGCNAGYLNVLFEGRHRIFTDIAPSGLGASVGSQWPTVIGFNVQSFIPKQAYWEQEFGPRGTKVVLGIIDPAILFFGTRATDQNLLFLNGFFADNPSVAYPSAGLGSVLTWKPLTCLQFRAGVCDANGGRTDDPHEDFLQGEFFYAAEAVFQTEVPRFGLGNYRIGLWHADERAEERRSSGSGITLNFDQDMGEHVTIFGMYGRGFDGLKTTRQSLRGGFGVWGPFRGRDDVFGFGCGWGQPTNRTLRDQFTGEVFYRIQMSPEVQLTPSIQWVVNPTLTAARDSVGIVGLRFRITL